MSISLIQLNTPIIDISVTVDFQGVDVKSTPGSAVRALKNAALALLKKLTHTTKGTEEPPIPNEIKNKQINIEEVRNSLFNILGNAILDGPKGHFDDSDRNDIFGALQDNPPSKLNPNTVHKLLSFAVADETLQPYQKDIICDSIFKLQDDLKSNGTSTHPEITGSNEQALETQTPEDSTKEQTDVSAPSGNTSNTTNINDNRNAPQVKKEEVEKEEAAAPAPNPEESQMGVAAPPENTSNTVSINYNESEDLSTNQNLPSSRDKDEVEA